MRLRSRGIGVLFRLVWLKIDGTGWPPMSRGVLPPLKHFSKPRLGGKCLFRAWEANISKHPVTVCSKLWETEQKAVCVQNEVGANYNELG